MSEGFDEHADCPGVDVEEDDAGIQPVLVLGGDEVDFGEIGGREEDVGGDCGIYYYRVGVHPPMIISIS